MPLSLGDHVPLYQVPPKVSRPGHWREGKQQLHTIPCGCGRQYSTKHHLKSPGSEWSGAIVVREFRVGRWKRGRGRKVRE